MSRKKKILIAFGTRPEALKFAPLIRAMKESSDFEPLVCLTGQHRQMLDQVVKLFRLKVTVDLNLMRPNQTLSKMSGKVIDRFEAVIAKTSPDLVFVQGDTSTALMAGIAAFYSKVPVAHLEAGLRTWNKYQPFPEEMNRQLLSVLADMHFTPTSAATKNLVSEGHDKKTIYEVGNTIVDTVNLARPLVKKTYKIFQNVDTSKRIVFLTAHRRESFGKPLEHIFHAVRDLARTHEDIEIVFPVHLNPNVSAPAKKILAGRKRVHLVRPLTYEETYWIMNKSYLILTDSGGLQEEAPCFRKPALVLRKVTERPEGVKAGIARLVGTDRALIVKEADGLLRSPAKYKRMQASKNPYGDGTACRRILKVLRSDLNRLGAQSGDKPMRARKAALNGRPR